MDIIPPDDPKPVQAPSDPYDTRKSRGSSPAQVGLREFSRVLAGKSLEGGGSGESIVFRGTQKVTPLGVINKT